VTGGNNTRLLTLTVFEFFSQLDREIERLERRQREQQELQNKLKH
jgi:hypothetical protein